MEPTVSKQRLLYLVFMGTILITLTVIILSDLGGFSEPDNHFTEFKLNVLPFVGIIIILAIEGLYQISKHIDISY